jgi:hypothetical protein
VVAAVAAVAAAEAGVVVAVVEQEYQTPAAAVREVAAVETLAVAV